MALIHSLKNTLVNQPIAVVLLILLIYASFFRTLIVTASPDLFKYPVLRQGNDSNLLIVFYVQIMPDDFV
ncbi:hypothetical protein, partial [Escherichia coli]|uniref:hypothetical protein n=1 Tax=Escherichia coli TaxID=562 RepID=UPI000ADC9E98